MRAVAYDEFLAAAGLNMQALLSLRRRHQLALAFGRAEAFKGLGYVEVDAVGPTLTRQLNARGMDRTMAAQIVRVHWPVWLRAVAIVEAEFRKRAVEPVFFTVIDFVNSHGAGSHIAAAGTLAQADQIAAAALKIAHGSRPVGSTAVSVTDALLEVRRNAADAGFDWLDDFLPPLGNPHLEKLLHDGEDMLDRAIATARTQKAKEELARRAGLIARAEFEASLPHDDDEAAL